MPDQDPDDSSQWPVMAYTEHRIDCQCGHSIRMAVLNNRFPASGRCDHCMATFTVFGEGGVDWHNSRPRGAIAYGPGELTPEQQAWLQEGLSADLIRRITRSRQPGPLDRRGVEGPDIVADMDRADP